MPDFELVGEAPVDVGSHNHAEVARTLRDLPDKWAKLEYRSSTTAHNISSMIRTSVNGPGEARGIGHTYAVYGQYTAHSKTLADGTGEVYVKWLGK